MIKFNRSESEVKTINERRRSVLSDLVGTGTEVEILRGRYRGQIGVITDVEEDGDEYQFEVEVNGRKRYLGADDLAPAE